MDLFAHEKRVYNFNSIVAAEKWQFLTVVVSFFGCPIWPQNVIQSLTSVAYLSV